MDPTQGVSPTPSDPVGVDPVRLAFGALGFGLMVGLAVQALVTFGVRTMQSAEAPNPAAPAITSPPALLLLLGTLGGMVAAGIATASLLAPLRNIWRQSMLGFVAGFGSFALALVALPVDRAFGRTGLFGLFLLAGGLSVWIGRRLGRRPTPPASR